MIEYNGIEYDPFFILGVVEEDTLNHITLEYKKLVKDINITKQAVFGGVIRNGIAHMTFGNFQILAGDKAVVFCLPEAIHIVEDLFR